MGAILLDRGLVWAEGDVHRRQRKALTPAFGLSESKALMPRFLLVANKVGEKKTTGASNYVSNSDGWNGRNFNFLV